MNHDNQQTKFVDTNLMDRAILFNVEIDSWIRSHRDIVDKILASEPDNKCSNPGNYF